MPLKLKATLVIYSAVIAMLWLVPAKTSAHIVETDGDMSVTLHILPQDYPVINVPQTLEFIYGKPATGFDAHNCVCTMALLQNDRQILQEEVPATNSYFGKLTYTFKETGVYKVLLEGKPRHSEDFRPFNLTYNIRVAKSVPGEAAAYSKNSGEQNSLLRNFLVGIGVAGLATSAYVFYTNLKKGSK